MSEYVLRFTRGNYTPAETMRVYANTEKEAVEKLYKKFRLIACYPAAWETDNKGA